MKRDCNIFIDHLDKIKINKEKKRLISRRLYHQSQEYQLNRFLKDMMICQQVKMIKTKDEIDYISKTREE